MRTVPTDLLGKTRTTLTLAFKNFCNVVIFQIVFADFSVVPKNKIIL